MTVSQRLAELGIDLPSVVPPVAAYVPAKAHGDLVYTAGQLPMVSGALPETGKVGDGHGLVPASDAKDHARQCALNAIAAAAAAVGGVDRLTGSREGHRVRGIRPRVHGSARRHQRRERGARRDLRRRGQARSVGGRRAGAAPRCARRGRGRLLLRLTRALRAPRGAVAASAPAGWRRRGSGRSGACVARRWSIHRRSWASMGRSRHSG